MPFEQARRRKFTQLMADHILGNKDRDVAFSVVHPKRHTDHVRRDRRTPRPGTDGGRLLSTFGDTLERLRDA